MSSTSTTALQLAPTRTSSLAITAAAPFSTAWEPKQGFDCHILQKACVSCPYAKIINFSCHRSWCRKKVSVTSSRRSKILQASKSHDFNAPGQARHEKTKSVPPINPYDVNPLEPYQSSEQNSLSKFHQVGELIANNNLRCPS